MEIGKRPYQKALLPIAFGAGAAIIVTVVVFIVFVIGWILPVDSTLRRYTY